MAALYGRHAAFQELGEIGRGPNHYWIPTNDVPYKWEIGGLSYEGCAGVCGLAQYLTLLATLNETDDSESAECEAAENGTSASAAEVGMYASGARSKHTGDSVGAVATGSSTRLTRKTVEAAYQAIAAMEQPLTPLLISFLSSHPNVTLLGPAMSPHDEPTEGRTSCYSYSCNGRTLDRVPTISFIHKHKKSADVAAEAQVG